MPVANTLKYTPMGVGFYDEMQKIAKGMDADRDNFFTKALTYDGSSSGADFIPEKWAANIIRQIYEKAVHRQLFNTYVMSAIKENIPKFTSRMSGSYQSASITSTDPANQLGLSSPTTGEREIELKTLYINLMVDNKFLVYNASPQIEEKLMDDLVEAIAETELTAIINGDDSTTHQDSDVTVASDARKAFKGLRKLATATAVDASGGAYGIDDFNKQLRYLGRYARGKYDQCVLFVSPAGAEDMRQWTQLQTMEKYGPNAVVVKGEVGKVQNVTVIETDLVRDDLNASGVNGATTTLNVFTVAILCNAKMQYMGVPKYADRTLKIRKWDDPRFDRKQLIALEDFGFQTEFTESICIAKNITSA